MNLTSNLVTTLAGNVALGGGPPNNYGNTNGVGTASSFNFPYCVAVVDALGVAIVVRKILC